MSENRWHIVFAPGFDESAIQRARSAARVTVLSDVDEATLIAGVHECDALLVRTSAAVTRAVIAAAPRLKVIGRGGSGLDNIDLEAARGRGIAVVHTPDASTDAVADLTVGMMIALVRRLPQCDEAVRTGQFAEFRSPYCAAELNELTLGIIGLGRIGKAVARRCAHGFGMAVVYSDIVDVGPLDFEAAALDKFELYGRADVVSLHVPLTDLTRGLIDTRALRRFKTGSYLINTCRGPVVDASALARSLESGDLAGAALDVSDPEPLPPDHPLLRARNALFAPHIAARTAPSLTRMDGVVDQVIRMLVHGG